MSGLTTSSGAATPLSGATSEETEASKWPWAIMGLPDLAVGCTPETLCLLIGFGNPFPTIYIITSHLLRYTTLY